jgi:hypothetical protein
MMKMVKAITPNKVVDIKDMERELASWEEAVRDLQKEYDEEISNKMKMAIFTSICPPSLQDIVYQKVDSHTTYASLKELVMAIVRNRIGMNYGSAVKMEIGEVELEVDPWYDVDYVTAATQCYKCHGYCQVATTCSSKGKGKSNFGGGMKGGKNGKSKGAISSSNFGPNLVRGMPPIQGRE